jgi:hypothetical protein
MIARDWEGWNTEEWIKGIWITDIKIQLDQSNMFCCSTSQKDDYSSQLYIL